MRRADGVGRADLRDSTQYPLGYAYTVGVGECTRTWSTQRAWRLTRLTALAVGAFSTAWATACSGRSTPATARVGALSDNKIALIGGDPWNPPSIRADLHMLNMETGECDVTIHCSSDVPPPTLVDPAVTCSLCQAPDDPNITQCRLQGPVEKVFEVVDGMLSVPTWTYNFTDSNSGDEYDVLVDNTGVEIQRNGEVVQTLTR